MCVIVETGTFCSPTISREIWFPLQNYKNCLLDCTIVENEKHCLLDCTIVENEKYRLLDCPLYKVFRIT